MTDTNATEPDHYADLLGMNLWELVRSLRFIEGNILKYIWRAGLKDGVSAKEDYAKALTYLDKVDPKEHLSISKDFFLKVPLQTLLYTAYGLELNKVDDAKASMLYHFFYLLLHKKLIGEYLTYHQCQYHYDALRLALIEEIEDEPPFNHIRSKS